MKLSRALAFFNFRVEKSIDLHPDIVEKRVDMKAPPPISWRLPLDRTHTGIPLANGLQGLLVWGTDKVIITVGRAGFWDRRGGNPFLSKTTYREIKELLQAGDEAGLMRVFGKNTNCRDSARPHQIGGGRLEIGLPPSWEVTGATLDLARGGIRIEISDGRQHAEVHIHQTTEAELARIDLPPICRPCRYQLRPAWEWIGDQLKAVGCAPPRQWANEHERGFVQELPEDPPLAMRVQHTGECILITTAVGPRAEAETRALLEADHTGPWARTRQFWEGYWRDVPAIQLPDPVLQELVDLGLYMQACCTPQTGIACSLQGPLMECEHLPPWSNDYHFNINLQMIYTPALPTNRADHFQPLWQLIREWLPTLQESGRAFFAEPEALMLPHAVDDQCHVVGAFWTGSIDHGCTAWMALLAHDYYRYSQDGDFLRELAWPLLKGAWAGYRAMLEQDASGCWHLPASVSPEYKGCRMDAWGEDASFQLAALHAVLRALPKVARLLDEPIDPEWAEIQSHTPRFASAVLPDSYEFPEMKRERIILWRGQDLDGSHRHHSHLAGITPFRTLDPKGEDEALIRSSLNWWIRCGPGAWSGWCVPWAALIHARCDHPDAAVAWLHTWNAAFTNAGRASLHNANFPGISTLDDSPRRDRDVMQLDGRFGALSAVLELLVQDWNDEIRVLPRLPSGWSDLSFDGISAPGGFLIGARVRNGIIIEVSVLSKFGNPLSLRIGSGRPRKIQLAAGESLRIHTPN